MCGEAGYAIQYGDSGNDGKAGKGDGNSRAEDDEVGAGMTLKDRIRKRYIWGTAGEQLGSGEWERNCEVRDCGGTGM